MTPNRDEMPDEPPPFLGSWRRIYTLVLLYLLLIIAGAYVFMRVFA